MPKNLLSLHSKAEVNESCVKAKQNFGCKCKIFILVFIHGSNT